jgi:hypothetical protein
MAAWTWAERARAGSEKHARCMELGVGDEARGARPARSTGCMELGVEDEGRGGRPARGCMELD